MLCRSTLDSQRRRSASPPRDERGATLIELLVAVSVMATAVIALMGGLATTILVSDVHRKQAAAGSYVRAFAEAVQSKVAEPTTGYAACTAGTSPAGTYAATYTVPNPGTYQREVISVAFWDSAASSFVMCPAAGDTGVQRVSLRVWTLDGRASETLDVVIRKPCRPGDGCT